MKTYNLFKLLDEPEYIGTTTTKANMKETLRSLALKSPYRFSAINVETLTASGGFGGRGGVEKYSHVTPEDRALARAVSKGEVKIPSETHPPNSTSHYMRKPPLIPVNEVLPLLRPPTPHDRKPREMIDGDRVKVGSLRLLTFKNKGTKCAFCGLEATHFVKERHSNEVPWHLNLYGVDEQGREVLFTKDHIIPKIKGGPDHLDNMQTACAPCNHAKGSK